MQRAEILDIDMNRRTILGTAVALAAASLTGMRSAQAAEESSWKRLDDGSGPGARWDHTLAYDENSKQLLVFGGRDINYAALGDTWLYDLVTGDWKAVDSPGPDPRFGHAVAVDQEAAKLILFGGQSADLFYNDTWIFDFESEIWTSLDTGSSPLPSPRYGLPAAIDGDGKFIVSHGFTFEGRFDDTWSLDLSTGEWTEISPTSGETRPLKRCLHEMAWDRDSGTLLLYGGCSSGFGPCPQGDLWAFDPAARAWTELTPGDGPAPRSNPAWIYDKNAKRTLLLGGLTDAGYVSDAWAGGFSDEQFGWEALAPAGEAPSTRASHDIALSRGDIYLFGGTGDAGVTADLWKLSLE